jgi:fatty-acyl-CoA synthase
VNEAGEAIGPLLKDQSNIGARFEGYTDEGASQRKILRDVFEAGDAWFRTGDLMKKDEAGYFYFVDRIGDTFRWKGENVATSEVSEAICRFPGIKDASVYGVAIPGTDGRAGMATIVAGDGLDLDRFRTHLTERLPDYARPVFLRVRDQLDVTSTFKHTKNTLVRDGYDPVAVHDPVFFHDRARQAFVPLDQSLYDRIQRGEVRA